MTTQCLDVTVLKSGEGSVKSGAKLRLDVPLVKGNRLFERATPQFSTTMVDVGSVLSVTVRGSCFQKAGATDYIVDPTCITPLRGVPADRKPK